MKIFSLQYKYHIQGYILANCCGNSAYISRLMAIKEMMTSSEIEDCIKNAGVCNNIGKNFTELFKTHKYLTA